MHMARHAANALRLAPQTARDFGHVSVKAREHVLLDPRLAIFRAEHEMDNDATERLRHGLKWLLRRFRLDQKRQRGTDDEERGGCFEE